MFDGLLHQSSVRLDLETCVKDEAWCFFFHFLLQDLDHQRRCLEEDNTCLRAEIERLKADARPLTRETRRARGLGVSHGFIYFSYLLEIKSLRNPWSRREGEGRSFIFHRSFSTLELRVFNSVLTLAGGLWARGINGGEALIRRVDVGPHFQPRCHSPGTAWPPHSGETL